MKELLGSLGKASALKVYLNGEVAITRTRTKLETLSWELTQVNARSSRPLAGFEEVFLRHC